MDPGTFTSPSEEPALVASARSPPELLHAVLVGTERGANTSVTASRDDPQLTSSYAGEWTLFLPGYRNLTRIRSERGGSFYDLDGQKFSLLCKRNVSAIRLTGAIVSSFFAVPDALT